MQLRHSVTVSQRHVYVVKIILISNYFEDYLQI